MRMVQVRCLVPDPFALSFTRVHAPMKEHAKPGLPPPGDPFAGSLTKAGQRKGEDQEGDEN